MKLKLTQRTTTEKETDIDLPVYFYYQGELMDEEYIKWDGSKKITVKTDWNGSVIECTNIDLYLEEYQLKNLCSKEEFDEALENALKYLKE